MLNGWIGKQKDKKALKGLKKVRKPVKILLWIVVVGWSVMLGWGIAQAQETQETSEVEAVELGKEVYLENCSSCHIPIPPEVLPTETWQEIIENPQNHYGTKLSQIFSITQRLIWEYVRRYSRPLNPDEKIPMYMDKSRYFKALHPRVELPEQVTHQSCQTCHLGTDKLDYRSLTPQWENSP